MGLTEKEIVVVQLRAQGLTQNQVAKRLDISQAAVSNFEQNARKKLNDAQRTIAIAKDLKLIVEEIAPARTRKGVRK